MSKNVLKCGQIQSKIPSKSKRYIQLRVKDLPKIHMWRLERDSYPQPSGREAPTLPILHHSPPHVVDINNSRYTYNMHIEIRIRNIQITFMQLLCV